MPLDFV